MELEPLKFELPPLDTPLLKASLKYDQADSSKSFSDSLKTALSNLTELHNQTNQKLEEYAAGGNLDISDVMLTIEKTTMATDFALQVRNKLLEGYQEIIRMQI